MRWPRMTTRRWMSVVAICAFVCAGLLFLAEQLRRHPMLEGILVAGMTIAAAGSCTHVILAAISGLSRPRN